MSELLSQDLGEQDSETNFCLFFWFGGFGHTQQGLLLVLRTPCAAGNHCWASYMQSTCLSLNYPPPQRFHWKIMLSCLPLSVSFSLLSFISPFLLSLPPYFFLPLTSFFSSLFLHSPPFLPIPFIYPPPPLSSLFCCTLVEWLCFSLQLLSSICFVSFWGARSESRKPRSSHLP